MASFMRRRVHMHTLLCWILDLAYSTYSFINLLSKNKIWRSHTFRVKFTQSAWWPQIISLLPLAPDAYHSQDDRHSFIVFHLCAILQRVWQPLMERTNNITAKFSQSNQNSIDKIKPLFLTENSVAVRNTSH